MSKTRRFNSHRTLTILIAANIVFDITAIVVWAALPANTWNGMYRLDSSIAISEAALAATFFAITLFGLSRMKKWAPVLAIGLTLTQRAFAIYVFYPSYAIPIPLIWSLLIIYFSIQELRKQQKLNPKL